MANERKIDCVILGLLSREELTGYEIKKRMDTAMTYFWGASYGSIYPALSDLVKRGLATKRGETENGRNKLIYAITDRGREYLGEWLELPVEKDELRYETLLKLFFANEMGEQQALSHIEAFQTKIEKELLRLLGARKLLRDGLKDDPAYKYRYLTVMFGIKSYRAYLEWCGEAKKMLDEKENL